MDFFAEWKAADSENNFLYHLFWFLYYSNQLKMPNNFKQTKSKRTGQSPLKCLLSLFWRLFRNAEQASPVLSGRLKCLLSLFWRLFRNAEQASPVLSGRLKCLLSLCFGVCSGMLSGPALSWVEGLSACCHCFGVCSGMLNRPALSWVEGLSACCHCVLASVQECWVAQPCLEWKA